MPYVLHVNPPLHDHERSNRSFLQTFGVFQALKYRETVLQALYQSPIPCQPHVEELLNYAQKPYSCGLGFGRYQFLEEDLGRVENSHKLVPYTLL